MSTFVRRRWSLRLFIWRLVELGREAPPPGCVAVGGVLATDPDAALIALRQGAKLAGCTPRADQ